MDTTNFTLDTFPFDNIILKTPKALQGGTYSSELVLNDKPIIIQTPKCKTKHGIHNTSKISYCDLLMNSDHEEFISCLEKLQEKIRDLILENGENWFQEAPTLDEIEYNWNSSIRTYKQKNFLIRTFIDKNKSFKNAFKIFNTEGSELTDSSALENNSVIGILEIKRMKFSSQSFALEIKLRQVMVIKEEPIFNKCLIKFNSNTSNNLEKNNTIEKDDDSVEENNVEQPESNDEDDKLEDAGPQHEQHVDKQQVDEQPDSENETTQITEEDNLEQKIVTLQHENENIVLDISKNLQKKEEEDDLQNMQDNNSQDVTETVSNDTKTTEKNVVLSNIVETSDISENDLSNSKTLEKNELEEVSLNVDDDDTIKLKNPNDVYLDIYRIAKEKAKLAKKQAIKAYLEAKKIKDLYLLDSVDTSEDDSDEELELFSEN